jgi:hypothetical protein
MSKPCQYEFSESENQILIQLVKKMKKASVAIILGGFIFALYNAKIWFSFSPTSDMPDSHVVIHHLDYFLWVIIGIGIAGMGYLVLKATKGFKLVVDTKGEDIDNLMHSLKGLCSVCHMILWVLIPCLFFIVISFIFLFLFAY